MTFEQAFQKVIKLEGGFTLHKNETETDVTYAGIYRKAHPKWDGWSAIDKGQIPSTDLVRDFYKREYWDKIPLEDGIKKYVIFEYGVNAGLTKATKLAQIIAGSIPDGVIGKKTLEALSKIDDEIFTLRYFVARVKHYNDLSAQNRFRPYLRGWINRALEAVC